jgi:putative transposase
MTTSLARTYTLIGLEDLNTKGMLANHCLAGAVSDASFFEVQRQLLYKAEQYGGYVQLVSQWYPSSKTCHSCGWIKEDLALDDRVWLRRDNNSPVERKALALSAERVKLAAMKQVRRCCKYVLLHFRKQRNIVTIFTR